MHIGKRLRIWRIENDLKLKDLAAMQGCSMAFASKVELGQGKMPAAWLPNLPDFFQELYVREAAEKAQQEVSQAMADFVAGA